MDRTLTAGRPAQLAKRPPPHPGAPYRRGVILNGIEWVPTGEACRRLGVGPETLRNWYAPRGGRPARVRLLHDVEDRPVRLGRAYLVAWPDCVEAEYAARTEPTGRPRQFDRTPAAPG